MIEVSQKEYWKFLDYQGAILYCSLLVIDGKNDWRLPLKDEVKLISKPEKPYVIWYSNLNRFEIWENCIFKCVPVRDIYNITNI